MIVKYNVVERGNPSDPSAPKKYYPSALASGSVDLRGMAEKAVSISTLSEADTVAVVDTFLKLIPDELRRGNVVQLGDFGSFWVKFKTEASTRPEEVNANNITGILVRFIPGKEFKARLKDFSFEKNKDD